jgi:hypothetical protein
MIVRDVGLIMLAVVMLGLLAVGAAKMHGKDDGPLEERLEEALEALIQNSFDVDPEIINIDVTPGSPEKE